MKPSISFRSVTKTFGGRAALEDLSVDIPRGHVTALLGLNGAGKSTALRIALGLVEPSGGAALIEGVAYRDLRDPTGVVGAVLEPAIFHPGRSGRDHLLTSAIVSGIDPVRVDLVLDEAGVGTERDRPVGTYSLGMRQRLSLAAGILGDPRILVLDEPATGLDPGGMRWLRTFLLQMKEEGKTVLLSSHSLSDVARIADRVLVLHRGLLVADEGVADLLSSSPGQSLEDVSFRIIGEPA